MEYTGCDALGVGCSVEAIGHFAPVTFDPTLVASVRKAAEDLGYSHMNIISGAGHDAQMMARLCPTAMVFIPSIGGLSHNPAEFSTDDDMVAGANILLTTAWRVANA